MTDTTTTGEILVQDTLGRVRTPREKREQILDEYERSGMSGAASLATAATVHWVEAVPEREVVTAPPTSGTLRVQIGAAVWLEVSNVEQASWAGQMLRAMGVERC